jgi:DNA-3-methyladenine glycosylase II
MSLTYDPAEAIAHLTTVDPIMGDLISRAGAFTLTPELTQSPFHALMRAIVYQQLSGKAAGTILGRVLALMPKGRGRPRPEDLLAIDDERLRTAGLSGNKLLALRDLATKAQDGTVPTLGALCRLTDEEIIERLTAVRGIGVWTVEMLLLFRLGRSDVLPVADLGVQKGFQITYRTRSLPNAKRMQAAGEKWRPYRSVASWYLWRAVDLLKLNGMSASG